MVVSSFLLHLVLGELLQFLKAMVHTGFAKRRFKGLPQFLEGQVGILEPGPAGGGKLLWQ
ncbi:MAG: hypothetical protein LRY35_05135 [Clostridiales bacterium]|nr:hypothetical protein [Clostridiales bacterium]